MNFGSSPHAWGIRLTSAAGISPITVHPHMRGAYICRAIYNINSARFIPTCVGHTMTKAIVSHGYRGSSPHAWGILSAFACDYHFIVGSSPHAWGIRMYREKEPRCKHGSSPHAWGIPLDKDIGSLPVTVHPHMRGAYGMTLDQIDEAAGSSPHAWGIHFEKVRIYAVSIICRPSKSTTLLRGSPCIFMQNPCSFCAE